MQKCAMCGKDRKAGSLTRKTSDGRPICKYCLRPKRKRRNMKDRDHYVYILVDPRDSRIKYVGCTVNVQRRMYLHAHRYEHYHIANLSPKIQWAVELMNSGHDPILVVLEKVSGKVAKERETFWMRRLYRAGAPLTNVRGLEDLRDAA